ncbi:hypothetical protein ATM97_02880 [Nocardia sp. MH4]|uniref:hypothetical protein n=1 Tax=Nocardia sp. MH4 TaxID=1768677 RepID=UPI001C4E9677|nr:hypothetical protein [Nocardia sp. MH4]MBW0270065.1 hypothetical protein [Nocardia sp. MH4]
MSSIRLSPRDMWALQWVAEMYAVPMSVLAALLGTSEQNAYRVASRWKAAGMLPSKKTYRPIPGSQWVVPSSDVATSLLGFHCSAWVPGPKNANHLVRTAQVRIALAGNKPGEEDSWISERVLRHSTRPESFGGARPHLHDGHFTDDLGRLHAIEVELTRKGSADAKAKVRAAYDAAKKAGAASLIYYAANPDVATRVITAGKAVLRPPTGDDPDFRVTQLDELIDIKTETNRPRGLFAAGGAA